MANKRNYKEHIIDLNVAVDIPTWQNTFNQTVMAAFDAMGIEGEDLAFHANDTHNFTNTIN